jgi:hypothetical protein
MSTVKPYTPTQDVQNVVNKFKSADEQFKSSWAEFYERHQAEIDQLDALRESRNVALDESKKMLRSEAERLDVERYKSFKYDDFQVSKPFASDSYRAVEFVKLAKAMKLDKAMEDEGVIATKVEINFDGAQEFLKKNGATDKFASLIEVGKAKTPSVTGPNPIPAFGQEIKGAK